MNIVFMGTPGFAVPSLERLVSEGYNIKLVVTQPDKPFGRGKKIKKSEVKVKAEELGLEVYQPDKVKNEEAIEKISALNPDLIIVIAYGQILSKKVLDIPRLGCINVHASLLPILRGAAPINWSIINGHKKTGVTTMMMDVGLDTGDMLLKEELEITENMTAGDLHDKLSLIGSDLLMKTLEQIKNKTIIPVKQDTSLSTYAPMINKSTALINWNEKAQNVHNMVRGLNPDQIAYFIYDDKNIKVYTTIITNEKSTHEPGTVERVDKTGIYVATSDYLIVIKELQIPGKNKMKVQDFLRGNKFEVLIKL
ncbi:methionyl-tRNA formyltransferase [Sedimentibacter sp. zth1]|uniref:methionyl-tRNA formyltransferase n=1 Tax=Sedimentibacter sp. zth1 TaxID=2816908 RepID=UPI001A934F62|nr:methionyl-tRNA formyltransferase [Sedimentibacter sp. zth1]QSX06862.1 methionyl-tRNA formyltransferase [Sedimentibacter sp. zth1]